MRSASGVFIKPGKTALQRSPHRAYCVPTCAVNAFTAPFDAVYASSGRRNLMPDTEEILTIEPEPASSILGTACLHVRNMLLTLVAKMHLKSASVVSRAPFGLTIPTLFTKQSRRPQVAKQALIISSTSNESATSHICVRHSPPISLMAFSVLPAAPALRSTISTLAPWLARRTAIAFPMLQALLVIGSQPAPVTTTTLFTMVSASEGLYLSKADVWSNSVGIAASAALTFTERSCTHWDKPPSTGKMVPEMFLASSDAR
mmetsp:Transcript_14918/g.34000  ORF Transcript_14918/g.34000 Transcript_14918/m.34000 type:complete len:260 (-) Transcript_14918:967-1746(-)